MKYSVLILWPPTVLWIEGTHWKKQAGLVRQFKIIWGLLQLDQPWLKPMQIWHMRIKTRKCLSYLNYCKWKLYLSRAYVLSSFFTFCRGLMELAIISYKQALQLRPDFPEVTCNLLHTLQVWWFFSTITLLISHEQSPNIYSSMINRT